MWRDVPGMHHRGMSDGEPRGGIRPGPRPAGWPGGPYVREFLDHALATGWVDVSTYRNLSSALRAFSSPPAVVAPPEADRAPIPPAPAPVQPIPAPPLVSRRPATVTAASPSTLRPEAVRQGPGARSPASRRAPLAPFVAALD